MTECSSRHDGAGPGARAADGDGPHGVGLPGAQGQVVHPLAVGGAAAATEQGAVAVVDREVEVVGGAGGAGADGGAAATTGREGVAVAPPRRRDRPGTGA